MNEKIFNKINNRTAKQKKKILKGHTFKIRNKSINRKL